MSTAVTTDAQADAAELLRRAQAEHAAAQAAARQQHGGIRGGILPGGVR